MLKIVIHGAIPNVGSKLAADRYIPECMRWEDGRAGRVQLYEGEDPSIFIAVGEEVIFNGDFADQMKAGEPNLCPECAQELGLAKREIEKTCQQCGQTLPSSRSRPESG